MCDICDMLLSNKCVIKCVNILYVLNVLVNVKIGHIFDKNWSY